mmetsp:Transcript_20167/g.36527  ORF Transcript_20167/g.36527 Transcript_20167/m.36527 type:complete len:318 (+) Transcript_20167:61-1014(+)
MAARFATTSLLLCLHFRMSGSLVTLQGSVSKVLDEASDNVVSVTEEEVQPRLQVTGVNELLCPVQRKALRSAFMVLKRLYTEFNWTRYPRDCALVSNSGVLLNHKHGAEIDAAELVIRFNDAEIGSSWRDNVGVRDDIRILNAGFNTELFDITHPRLDMRNDTLYVLQRVYPFESGGMQLYAQIQKNMEAVPWHIVADSSNNAELVAKLVVRTAFGGKIPEATLTTGTIGGMMALALCEEVRAYGFPETSDSQNAPFHYYGELQYGSASNNSRHVSASAEKMLWRTLATNADVESTAVAVVPGFSKLNCSSSTVGDN